MEKQSIRRCTGVAATIGACALLFGCASPITSVYYDQGSGAQIEGLRYHLTKSTVKVKFSARLEECGPKPKVVLLPPSVVVDHGPDPDATFVVNPRDAWNPFRTIDVQKFALTEDGRVAGIQVQTTDNTISNLVDIAKAAAGTNSIFRALEMGVWSAQEPSTIPGASPQCIGPDRIATANNKETTVAMSPLPRLDTAAGLVLARQQARDRAARLQQSLAALRVSDAFSKDSAVVIKTYADQISTLQAEIASLDTRLTKTVTISIDDLGTGVALADLHYGWFSDKAEINKNCAIALHGDASKTKEQARQLVSTFDPDATDKDKTLSALKAKACLVAAVRLGSKVPNALTDSSAKDASGYGGILYRVPRDVGLVYFAVAATSGFDLTAKSEWGESTPAAAREVDWKYLNPPEDMFIVAGSDQQPMYQHGQIAKMPADIGLLTTNSVSTDFDKLGMPSSAKWKSEPIQLGGLIGLPTKAREAFASPSQPESTPTQLAQRELLAGLLKNCLDAIAAGVAPPSYCTSILK